MKMIVKGTIPILLSIALIDMCKKEKGVIQLTSKMLKSVRGA